MKNKKSVDWSHYKIGVFDTGLGGRQVATYLNRQMPGLQIINAQDLENLPYGNKSRSEIWSCLKPFLEEFKISNLDILLIACNTVFSNFGDKIKQMIDIPIIGYTPSIMLPAISKKSESKTVACCATKATLTSRLWQSERQQFSDKLKFYDFDCSHWVPLIEYQKIKNKHLQPIMAEIITNNIDSLILGCTHFHGLKNNLLKLKPLEHKLNIYEPSKIIVEQIRTILAKQEDNLIIKPYEKPRLKSSIPSAG